jgi:hypothetical protein
MSIFSLLTVLFVALKLLSVITWSWWWVLAPLYAPIVLIFIAAFIKTLIDND